ncbi:MAG: IS1182 family transposase [Thermoplasmata archaeon]
MPPSEERAPVFSRYDPKQSLLLPPDLNEWLPEEHLARFISEIVEESLDLSPLIDRYHNAEGGHPALHPKMLTKLLVDGYAVGVRSSRKIERATYEDLAFRYLSADQHPDHNTIARFRERNLDVLEGLFIQGLKIAERLGLVKLGRVAIDGTKVRAHASKHKAMSYGRMLVKEKELQATVRKLFAEARKIDLEEDARYGHGKRPKDLPEELKFHRDRLAKIRAAKLALEEEARARAEAEASPDSSESGGKVPPKERGGGPPPSVDAKAQRNFTDPESRIMPDGANKGAFLQGYNCQAAVDEAHQIIVGAEVMAVAPDQGHLVPMLERIEAQLGRRPEMLLADAGYFSEAGIRAVEDRGIAVYCPPGRGKTEERESCKRGRPPKGETFTEAQRRKVRGQRGRVHYRRRKAIVEPVFGQMKEGQRFRQFLLRGRRKVRGEWFLGCLAHNLRKIHRTRIN